MSQSRTFLLFTLALVFLSLDVSARPLQAQSDAKEYLRTNPKFLKTFHEITQKAAPSVVRIQCDGKDTCLGVVVGADGWILTKAHDLTGNITCKLKDLKEFDATVIGVDEATDLALLRIKAKQLQTISWSHSDKVRAGSWVASVGWEDDPAAVGVVSVATRQVNEAYLGVQLERSEQGLTIIAILKKSAAEKAGLLPKDIILRANGQSFTELEAFSEFLSGFRPADTIKLTIRRGKMDQEIKAVLQSREQGGDFRSEFQNRMGSELSKRRSGYPVILQHDSILKPSDCGGPLLDLKGRVVGINISRAGRVESWAIPAEVAQPLIAELKTAKYAPKEKKAE